ncbi:MAG: hypothetical protein V4447_10620 [Pseudomonadota bacterium]
MRTWGRIRNPDGSLSWVQINTDPGGLNDDVYITTLIQNLKLGLGESPFYANNGIPAQRSIITQIFPDFYVAQTQSQFAKYFASLQISKVPGTQNPTYNVNLVTHQGAKISTQIAT